jgi:Peptidase family M23
MYSKTLFKLAMALVITTSSCILNSIAPEEKAVAQGPKFLVSPYYGNKVIRSLFDHRFPNYALNNSFVRYDGFEWTQNVDKSTCLSGVNCYDGHPGLDIGLDYEPVLATAGGTVTKARWDRNCHEGSTCGLGMTIQIQHFVDGQNYRTTYGHISTINVTEGQSVNSGEIIGTSGSSGASSGAHLHFEVEISDNTWKYIDPFGWNPEPGAQVTVDPWANTLSGHESWCMWLGGEWTTCDHEHPGKPIRKPIAAKEDYIDDNTNNLGGFSKGFGGLWNNPCTGNCGEWWSATQGIDADSFRGLANGGTVIGEWAKWQPQFLRGYSDIYEVLVYLPSINGYSNSDFTWQAKYTIVDAAGRSFVAVVDENRGWNGQTTENPRDKWLSLGTYYLNNLSYVYVTDATGEDPTQGHCPGGPYNGQCRMVIDAIKFVELGTNYLPNIRRQSDNWWYRVFVGNNSDFYTTGKVDFFEGGSYRCGWGINLAPHARQDFITSCTQSNSAKVTFNQDVSVVVEGEKLDSSDETNYTGVLPSGNYGDPGWERIGTTLYAPTIKRNRYDRSSSIEVQNVGRNDTNVYVTYYNDQGYSRTEGPFFISVNQSLTLYPTGTGNGVCDTSGYPGTICAAKIYSSELLAGVVREYDTTTDSGVQTHNVFASGANNIYFPVVKKNRYNMTTGLRLKNNGGSTANLTINFYQQNGQLLCQLPGSIPGYAGYTVSFTSCPGDNYVGPVKITSNQPIIGLANEASSDGISKKAYSSVIINSNGSKYAYAPIASGSQSSWYSGISVLNLTGVTANITIQFYNYSDGNMGSSPIIDSIPAYGMKNFYSANTTFNGSAVISSDQNIAALVFVTDTRGGGGDTQAVYNASSRP